MAKSSNWLQDRPTGGYQARPGLSATAVTTAALTCAPLTLIEHATVVVELYPTSGRTCAWQLPTVLPVAGSVMVKVTVDGAWAALRPPRFLSSAATEQGAAQPEVSTDTTV